MYWLYVIQSLQPRERGKPGFYYVGIAKDPSQRLRKHNGEISGGGKFTAKYRPWVRRALYGPYSNRSEAQKAELALKKLRGSHRVRWRPADSSWCRGEGPFHLWVKTGRLNP